MVFIKNLGNILIISIVIIALILIVVIIKEKKLNKRIRKKNWNAFYISEIKKIDKSNPKKILSSINKITRNFFKEAFKIRKFTGYSELKKFFNRKNNVKAVEFCELMSIALYSKEKDNNKIEKLINLLIEIIKTNKIISKEEQIKTEKKSKNYLRNIKIFGIFKKKLNSK